MTPRPSEQLDHHDDDSHRALAALAAAGVGVWDWDVVTGEIIWDGRIAELHGLDPADFDGTLETFLSRVHPDDEPVVGRAIQDALPRGGPFRVEYRVIRPDGSTSWIQGRGAALQGPEGTTVRMLGIGADTTVLHDVRERAGRTLDHISDGVVILDRDWTIVYANAEACRLVNVAPGDLIGTGHWEQFPETIGTEIWDRYHEALERQEPRSFQTYYGLLDGWFDVRAFGAPDGVTVYFQNANERRQAEEAHDALVAELEVALARQRQLQGATVALANALTVEDVARITLQETEVALGTRFAGVAVLDEAADVLRFVTLEPLPQATVEEWQIVPMDADVALVNCVRNRTAEYHATAAELLADYPHLAATVATVGSSAFASAALVLGDRVIGALSMSWTDPRPFTDDDRAYINALAAQCALAIDRTLLFARERGVADTLQRSVLPPSLPEVAGVTIDACYLPATRGLSIGGDWYDALELPGGDLLVAVGDVSGHGVDAASVMGQVRNALRGFVIAGHGPAETLALLDDVVSIAGHGLFATVIIGIYDPGAGVLRWANAGHPPLLLRDGSGIQELDGTSGAPVGVGGPRSYADVTTVLAEGDRVVGYTDGLIERRREDLASGTARLVAAIAGPPEAPLGAGWCDGIALEVTIASARYDDICILAIERTTGR